LERNKEPGCYTTSFSLVVASYWLVPAPSAPSFRHIMRSTPTHRPLPDLYQGFRTRTSRNWNRDSTVGIATGYGLDDRGFGVRVHVGSRIFFSTSSRLALWATQPPIQWEPGALSPGIKRQGREADHSSPAIAEVKKTWIYTVTPQYAFMA
jgi:hypothetical protein